MSDQIIKNKAYLNITNELTRCETFQIELEEEIQTDVPFKPKQKFDMETQNFVRLVQEAPWNNTMQIKIKASVNNYP